MREDNLYEFNISDSDSDLFPHQWLSCTLKQWEATNGKRYIAFNFSCVSNFLVDAHPVNNGIE